jgi:hypothetical protein
MAISVPPTTIGSGSQRITAVEVITVPYGDSIPHLLVTPSFLPITTNEGDSPLADLGTRLRNTNALANTDLIRVNEVVPIHNNYFASSHLPVAIDDN